MFTFVLYCDLKTLTITSFYINKTKFNSIALEDLTNDR